MKSADEIKMGLKHAAIDCRDAHDCDKMCAYYKECTNFDYEITQVPCTMLFDALALIQQLEAHVPRWISVEERLPENYATVIIFRDDCRNACIGWLIGGSWSVPKGVRVTHWMPLPEPPKEATHD